MNDPNPLTRSEFLRLSTSIIGALGIPGVFGKLADAAEAEATAGAPLDDSYLANGLTGMARAAGWFDAHWGASVLAGYYLCRDNRLDEATTAAIKKQLDTVIRLRRAQFAPLAEEAANDALIEEIPRALWPAIKGGLRAHGHAVIFASLATKALRDARHMARPAVINPLCGLSRQIARQGPEKPKGEAGAYTSTQSMIEATFDSLARFNDLLGRPAIRRPNFTHMITHTEALMNLEAMGYTDLAMAGHDGHRAHIGAPVPEIDRATEPAVDRATLETVMNKSYWENEANQDQWRRKWNATNNRNGDWIASGHLFKVLYSFHRLVARIEDQDKVRLCSMVLLERYMNPDVQGG